jgi:hypothetical protein
LKLLDGIVIFPKIFREKAAILQSPKKTKSGLREAEKLRLALPKCNRYLGLFN